MDMNMDTWRYEHGGMDMKAWSLKKQRENRRCKPKQFSLIRLAFAHHANGSLLFVCLLTKKQTEVIRLKTD